MSVLEEATRMSLLWSSTHDSDGAPMFCKTYWKQRFNYEIKLHVGQDDIHVEIYHWYALYCRSVHFFVGLKDCGTTLYKLKDLDLSIHVGLLTFFRNPWRVDTRQQQPPDLYFCFVIDSLIYLTIGILVYNLQCWIYWLFKLLVF